MNMDHLVDWKLPGETEVLGENPPPMTLIMQ
jgi:hypothetical protein